jgi:hypothetical protein
MEMIRKLFRKTPWEGWMYNARLIEHGATAGCTQVTFGTGTRLINYPRFLGVYPSKFRALLAIMRHYKRTTRDANGDIVI